MNEKPPLVTVITLTYNKFDNLSDCIKSVMMQDYPSIEHIICDDGSKPFPIREVEKLIDNNRGIDYVIETSEKNYGTVHNYNHAISIAKGDIIIPLAQDDVLYDNGCITEIVKTFKTTGCIICTGRRIGAMSRKCFPDSIDIDILKSKTLDRLLFRLLLRNFISGSTLYFKRKELIERGCFDEKYKLLEDWPLVLNCVIDGIQIEFIDKDLIYYGEKGVSSGNTVSLQFLKDEILLYQEIILPQSQMRVYNEVARKYIVYQYLKLVDKLYCQMGEQSNNAKKFLIKNLDLCFLIVKLLVAARKNKYKGTNRYQLLLNAEERTKAVIQKKSIWNK